MRQQYCLVKSVYQRGRGFVAHSQRHFTVRTVVHMNDDDSESVSHNEGFLASLLTHTKSMFHSLKCSTFIFV